MIEKSLVKKEAQRIGFDLIGFTGSEPFYKIRKILKNGFNHSLLLNP